MEGTGGDGRWERRDEKQMAGGQWKEGQGIKRAEGNVGLEC